ncbi:MAG: hypothetical protein ACLQBJ_16820 [Bryobacteraceae bacterium]
MKTLKLFFGAALLAVSSYMMVASAQTATSDSIDPLVYACNHTINCATQDNDCSQGGKFMACVCNESTNLCYVNTQIGN